MRVPAQVSVEGAVLKRLREKNVNLSAIVNDIMKRLDACQSASAEEIALAMLQAERDNLVGLISLHYKQIAGLKGSIEILDEKIKKQETLIFELRKSERIATAISKLNEELESCNFDFEAAWKLPSLDTLRQEGLPITEAWLQRHIRRIELMGR